MVPLRWCQPISRPISRAAPFPVPINVLTTTLDAGFVVLPTFLPIFVDGFETSTTARWSATVP